MCEDLFGERVHAATRLAGTDGAEDSYTCVKSAVGNREPLRPFRGFRALRMMQFSDGKEKPCAFSDAGVWRQGVERHSFPRANEEYIEEGKQHRAADERGGEQHCLVDVLDREKND